MLKNGPIYVDYKLFSVSEEENEQGTDDEQKSDIKSADSS